MFTFTVSFIVVEADLGLMCPGYYYFGTANIIQFLVLCNTKYYIFLKDAIFFRIPII